MSDDIQTGDRIMRSPITNTWYRVTKWRDKGGGKVQAIEKEEIPPEDVGDVIDELEEQEDARD